MPVSIIAGVLGLIALAALAFAVGGGRGRPEGGAPQVAADRAMRVTQRKSG
jgi:hypothetical protein